MADKKNSKATVAITPKTTSIDNVMNIEKQMLEVAKSVDKLMPVHLAKTIDDVNYLIDRANAVEGRFSLAKCRLFYRVKSEKLYEQGSKVYKTFKD